MIIEKSEQIEVVEIKKKNLDLFITSSGFEARTTHLPQVLKGLNSYQKICFVFNDNKIFQKEENLKFFKSENFKIIKALENDHLVIFETLKSVFEKFEKQEIQVVIDYSCMTKVWLGEIINFLKRFKTPRIKKISAIFSYTPSVYEDATPTNPSFTASLMHKYHFISSPNSKSNLIIGLGHEIGRAQGLVEYLHLDYKNVYLFRSDKNSNSKYYNSVQHGNDQLIRNLPESNIIEYPVRDINYTYTLLHSLVDSFANENKRVLVAPLGPKTFSFISLLLASTNRYINIYRTTQLKSPEVKPALRRADSEKAPIMCEVTYIDEDVT